MRRQSGGGVPPPFRFGIRNQRRDAAATLEEKAKTLTSQKRSGSLGRSAAIRRTPSIKANPMIEKLRSKLMRLKGQAPRTGPTYPQ
jgi:hypothetical protein